VYIEWADQENSRYRKHYQAEPIVPVRSQLPPEIFEASFGLEVRNRDRLAVDGVTPQAELTLGYLGDLGDAWRVTVAAAAEFSQSAVFSWADF
jgi:hypothetical protein